MGIRLMDNFDAPYYARSVREFWRRWHISLSGWFRDYLYIPLGGSRKGTARKEYNRMVVFAVSGLWHGASLSFLFWGLLNGMGQVAEDLAENIKKRLGNPHMQKAVCFSKAVPDTLYLWVCDTCVDVFPCEWIKGCISDSAGYVQLHELDDFV
jgi:D-alanyl-lipoteichoic acid acyltransferase DltB (MBOAT superfamily)